MLGCLSLHPCKSSVFEELDPLMDDCALGPEKQAVHCIIDHPYVGKREHSARRRVLAHVDILDQGLAALLKKRGRIVHALIL